MDVSRPHTAVAPGLEGEILLVLAGARRAFTGREVARLVHRGSTEGIRLALARLVEHGIVLKEQAGRSHLYLFNREHLAAPVVLQLAGLRASFFEGLKRSVSTWKLQPRHAALFGSAAREDGTTSSDIDIFLVRPARIAEDDRHWRSQVDGWAATVERWTGNRVSLQEISESDVRELRARRPAIVRELLRDSVTLAGEAPSRLFGGRT